MATNGSTTNGVQPLRRAEEAEDLLTAVQKLITAFILAADESAPTKSAGITASNNHDGSPQRSVLVDQKTPSQLKKLLPMILPENAGGREAFLKTISTLLQQSVNTWDQGFLDKLYSTVTPVGLASDLVLSALNTNAHVYAVSPALTMIEKTTARQLAGMYGFHGPFAGGVSQPGGSAANGMSMIVARNCLFPETKTQGLAGRRFVIFTSGHGHYSVEKAAQMFGFGSDAVRGVEVDSDGKMKVDALEKGILDAKERGEVPFYVNATAGTTVLGSFDPLNDISAVCKKHGLWMHVDGSWGAPIIFSDKQKHKLSGIEKADTITLCPHKMLNVPLTCSFLLGKDLREFHKGMTLPAGYLFHTSEAAEEEGDQYHDLADLTPQCGRRADSLKMALSWIYQGTEGFRHSVDNAFEMAAHLAKLLALNKDFELVSSNPPPCLQVCFYYKKSGDNEENSEVTRRIVEYLVPRGFMTDYAPGPEGKFFRVVVNGVTRRETVEGLVKGIEQAGQELGIA